MALQELQGEHPQARSRAAAPLTTPQRESSASIKAAPAPYEQTEPAAARKVLEFDCRGLEFTKFKPEVGCRSPFCSVFAA